MMRRQVGAIAGTRSWLRLIALSVISIFLFSLQHLAFAQEVYANIEDVDQSFDGPFDGQFGKTIGPTVLRQTFKSSKDQLSSVDIFVRKFTAGGSASVTIKVCGVFTTFEPCTDANLLGSVTRDIYVPSPAPNVEAEHFEFNTTISLVPGPGTLYMLEISSPSSSSYRLVGSEANPYLPGWALSGMTTLVNTDFGFRTYFPTFSIGFEEFLNDPDTSVSLNVIDPNANVNPSEADIIDVQVSSDTDPQGIFVSLVETAPDEARFAGGFDLTLLGTSSSGVLRVARGDLITAQYKNKSATAAVTSSVQDFTLARSFAIQVTDPDNGFALAAADSSLYWWQRNSGLIYLLDPEDGTVQTSQGTNFCSGSDCFPTDGSALAFDGTRLWLANDTLNGIFPETGPFGGPFIHTPVTIATMTFLGGELYALDVNGAMSIFNPTTGALLRFYNVSTAMAGAIEGMTGYGDQLIAFDNSDAHFVKIDPDNGSILSRFELPLSAINPIFGGVTGMASQGALLFVLETDSTRSTSYVSVYVPTDTDGDGIPDLLEDAAGQNGIKVENGVVTAVGNSQSGGLLLTVEETGEVFSFELPAGTTNSSVDSPIRVNTLDLGTGEPTIAISPANTNEVVAGSHYTGGCGTYRSSDGGGTWTETGEISTGSIGGLFDPVVAADSFGNFYFVCTQWGDGSQLGGVYVFKSSDGGQTWSPIIVKTGPQTNSDLSCPYDKPWITVDNFPDSPNFGNVYISVLGNKLLAIRSTNQGQTWTSTIIENRGGHSHPFAAPNGDVYVAYLGTDQFGKWGPLFVRSTNGGSSFSEPALIAQKTAGSIGSLVKDISFFYPAGTLPTERLFGASRYQDSLDACADGTGRLNVIWTDSPEGSSDTNIFYGFSTDNGDSWQGPFLVNDVTAGKQVVPAIACQDDGTVHMSWMDFRDDPGDLGPCLYSNALGEINDSCIEFHMYYAQTRSGIPPFKNIRLTETPGSLLNGVALSGGGGISISSIGDYIDMDASRFSVITIWPDMTDPPVYGDMNVHLAVSVRKAIVFNVINNEDMTAVEVLNANLPAGTTKSVTLPIPDSQLTEGVTIFDGEQATADALSTQEPSNVVQIPPPGENTNLNIVGESTQWTVTNNGDGTITVNGLLNTAVGILSDPRPPSIDVPSDVTVQCSINGGATGVSLGTATATDFVDPDPTIASNAPEFFPLGANEVVWTATDTSGNVATGNQKVTVVDTIVPTLACNAPATIVPPDAPISFSATASDICSGEVNAEITGYDCFKYTKEGKRIDKKESCEVIFAGNAIAINDSGGVGNNISWSVVATDDSGNTSTTECEVEVVNP